MRSVSNALGNLLILVSVTGSLLVAVASSGPVGPPWLDGEVPAPVPAVITPVPALLRNVSAVSDSTPSVQAEVVSVPSEFETADSLANARAALPESPLVIATPVPIPAQSAAKTAQPTSSNDVPTPPEDVAAPEMPEPVESRPITRVVLPRIGLSADVAPAELVEQDDSVTWLVPAFKAGHAQSTAGPGEPGNAVVFGHVTSRSLGNVFEQLHRAHVGDLVEIFGGEERFDYLVVDVMAVSRTDARPSRSSRVPVTGTWLFTTICSGLWYALS